MTKLLLNAQGSARSSGEQPMHFTPPTNHRFVFLDALRGIAALFVIAFHLPKVMTYPFVAEGQLAVDFFFCLSGFVIAFSYEMRLMERVSFKDFAIARLIRLYPIYALGSILGLLLALVVQHFAFHSNWSWSSSAPSLRLFTLAIVLWPTRLSSVNDSFNYPLNVPAWSLFYEIAANLAYALLVKLRLARTAVLLCVVAGSLALLFANVILAGRSLDFGARQVGFGLGFARVAFSFFLGVLTCRAYRLRKQNDPGADLTPWLPSLILTLALIVILSSPFRFMRAERFHLFAVCVLFPAMIYYGAIARLPRSFTHLSTALGELSYPLYILHFPLILLLDARHFLQFAAAHTTLSHCLAPCLIGILAVAAWWVGEHVDLPIRRALTRTYNSYKQKIVPLSIQTSTPE